MIFWLTLLCAIAMTIVQYAAPGAPVYHYGWYNVGLIVLILLAVRYRAASIGARRALGGGVLIAVAGAASGLLGPDTQTIVGAPGATIETADFGAIAFPFDAKSVPSRAYRLDAVLLAQPRDVVHVIATDAHGAHLTLTQPSGATFLSPVLTLQQHATIAGMDVRTDEFSLPAISRTVKVVYFNPAQSAQLRSPAIVRGRSAMLFDVSDAGSNTPRGLALVSDGGSQRVDGVTLHADVEEYPAIEAAAAPFLPLVAGGVLLLLSALVKTPSCSKK